MVNAFALPGGYVYVTRGLLATINSEAALAGVLGHEIGHVIGHHSVKMMKKSIGQALLALGGLAASPEIRQNAAAWLTVTSTLSQQILLGYGRDFEMESDQMGMILSHESGYDPDGIVSFLHLLRRLEKLGGQSYHGFQATHPDTITRIIEAEGKSSLLRARGEKYVDHRLEYLGAIDGLRYGKPKWKGRTLPPYKIKIYVVSSGDTFRSISMNESDDESLALENAVLNGMEQDSPLTPGERIKVIVPEKSVNRILQHKTEKKESKEDEIGGGTGDGEIRQPR